MYNFKEKQLPDDFATEKLTDIKGQLKPSGFFTIVGINGVGISPFLRFLSTRSFAHCVYIDILSLPIINKYNLFAEILTQLEGKPVKSMDEIQTFEKIKSSIKKILKKQSHIIFIFNRFDEFGKKIDNHLLANLRTLRHFAADKVSMIFAMHASAFDKVENSLTGPNLDMYSNFIYFTPYNKQDLLRLMQLTDPDLIASSKEFDQAYMLSGGHYQLCKLFLKSSYKKKPLKDKLIKFSLKNIYSDLSYDQKNLLRRIIFNKKVVGIDNTLINLGVLNRKTSQVFSPLLNEYIENYSLIKLPAKENTLFKLLNKNIENVVDKNVIYRTLWNEDDEEYGSDWALNSLIYRLRKNAVFKGAGYSIENYKKIGYILHRR